MPQRDLRSCPKIALDNNRPLASNVFILCVYVFGTKCAMLIIVEVRRASTSVFTQRGHWRSWTLMRMIISQGVGGWVCFSRNHKNTQWEHFQTEVRPAIIFSLCDDGSFLHGAAICEMWIQSWVNFFMEEVGKKTKDITKGHDLRQSVCLNVCVFERELWLRTRPSWRCCGSDMALLICRGSSRGLDHG